MRIVHILASDSDNSEDNRFIDMIYAYNSIGIEQFALIKNDKKLSTNLQQFNIPFKQLKLAGIFDLQSKKEIEKTINQYTPHILQAHSHQSISFASNFKSKTKVLGFLEPSFKDKDKLVSQTHALLSIEKNIDNKNEEQNIFFVHPLLILNSATTSTEDINLKQKEELNYIGTILDPYKKQDIDLLFKAIKEIKDTVLIISCNKEHHEELNNLILNYSLQEKVELLESLSSVEEFLEHLDILVILPRASEKDRLTISAWAKKVPHLYIGPFENSIATNKTNGLITGSESPVKIRSDLCSMLENNELLQSLKEQGYKTFSQEYDLQKSLLEYLKAYKEVLKTS